MEGMDSPEQVGPEAQNSLKAGGEGFNPDVSAEAPKHNVLSDLLGKLRNPFRRETPKPQTKVQETEASLVQETAGADERPLAIDDIADEKGRNNLEYLQHLAKKGQIGGAQDSPKEPLKKDLVIEIKKEG